MRAVHGLEHKLVCCLVVRVDEARIGSKRVGDSHRAGIQHTIDLDLDNTRRLLALWESTTTDFMLVSGVGETSFVYGENMGDLLRRKLELTEAYRDREPAIDADILWRLP